MIRYVLEKIDEPGIYIRNISIYPTRIEVTNDIEKAVLYPNLVSVEEAFEIIKNKKYKFTDVLVTVQPIKDKIS